MSLPQSNTLIQGPVLIGMMVYYPLFGLVCAQANFYYRNYPEDPRRLKWMVGICVMSDLVQLVTLSGSAYITLVYSKLYEHHDMLSSVDLSYVVFTIFHAGVSVIVQLFYARRVFTVSNGNRVLTLVIILLSLLQFVNGMILSGQCIKYRLIVSVFNSLPRILVPMRLATMALCDVLICITLIYYLRRSNTGIPQTENLVNRLVLLTINVGGITSVTAVLMLIVLLAKPASLFRTSLMTVMGDLYVNAMLVTLNSRKSSQKLLQSSITAGTFISDINFAQPGNTIELSTFVSSQK